MTTVAALKVLIKNQLNRGTIYDAVMDSYIKIAGKFLEKNYTFQYMRSYSTVAGTSGVRTLSMPTAFVKSFDMLRYATTAGKYVQMHQVHPTEVTENLSADPGYFWLDGRDTLYLDNTPARDITFELNLVELSDWANISDATTNWLLDVGQDCMLWHVLSDLAIADRDATLMQMAQAKFAPAINTLLGLDEAMEQSLRKGVSRYSGEE